MFLNTYPIKNMPCACQEPGQWYTCNDSFHPNSQLCKDLKLKARNIAKIHGPLVKNINGALGLLPDVLLPDIQIPHIPLSTPAAGRLPVPGKVKGPRLPDCEFDPLAEARKHAEAPARAARAAENPSGRFGTPDEFGAACAYLCSSHAGYITGQNLLIDGGGYPGTY